MRTDSKQTLSLGSGQTVEGNQGVTLAFATPLLKLSLPGAEFLNRGLRRDILDREAADPGRKVSNAGGWQSDASLFDRQGPELAILLQAIELGYRALCRNLAPSDPAAGAASLAVTGWANVNRTGHFNRPHSHPGVHWSGVYFVDAGDPPVDTSESGRLEFFDPRHLSAATPAPGFPVGHQLTLRPEPGLLVMFPAWLEHWVTPHRGTGTRISIGFNVVANNQAASG